MSPTVKATAHGEGPAQGVHPLQVLHLPTSTVSAVALFFAMPRHDSGSDHGRRRATNLLPYLL